MDLPPFGLLEVVSRWQFAPVVTGFVVVAAGLYLWGVRRVRRHRLVRQQREGSKRYRRRGTWPISRWTSCHKRWSVILRSIVSSLIAEVI